MYYVYELINLVGTIEYVGMTRNAKHRMVSHKCKNGLFHKRVARGGRLQHKGYYIKYK